VCPRSLLLRAGTNSPSQDMNATELRPQFEAIVRQYAGDLYRFAFYLSRDRQRAEDVVQEALLRGWRSFAALQEQGAVKSWLFTIVRNEYYRSIGQSVARGEEVELEEIELPDTRSSVFGSSVAGLEMRQALGALPKTYGEALCLQVLGGFSCGEIADLLDTTEGAVMTRLTRARQALRRLVEPVANPARREGGR
jgi:RNA polymerase sigma-70 factor, ECF subfamily